jgi:hypothetical protein
MQLKKDGWEFIFATDDCNYEQGQRNACQCFCFHSFFQSRSPTGAGASPFLFWIAVLAWVYKTTSIVGNNNIDLR